MSRATLAGPVLVLVGVVCWVLFVVQSRSQHLSFSSAASPPQSVRVVAGHTYSIAIHGGVRRLAELGIESSALHCTIAQTGQPPRALQLTAESSDSKANNQIATFVSAVSGDVQIRCTNIGAVYVDNAADASFDWSGLWLVLASLSLVIGLPLTLSLLRGTTRRAPESAARPVREYDEVQ